MACATPPLGRRLALQASWEDSMRSAAFVRALGLVLVATLAACQSTRVSAPAGEAVGEPVGAAPAAVGASAARTMTQVLPDPVVTPLTDEDREDIEARAAAAARAAPPAGVAFAAPAASGPTIREAIDALAPADRAALEAYRDRLLRAPATPAGAGVAFAVPAAAPIAAAPGAVAPAAVLDPAGVRSFPTLQNPGQPPRSGEWPLYVYDPVAPSAGAEAGFGCYGGCGPSCGCAGAKTAKVLVRETVGGVEQDCTYETVSCLHHRFCDWHDSCYYACDFNFPNWWGPRSACYRTCDLGCTNGISPESGLWVWPDPRTTGKAPPDTFGVLQCAGLATNTATIYDSRIQFSARRSCKPAPPAGAAGP
jgi:hypothetical protein